MDSTISSAVKYLLISFGFLPFQVISVDPRSVYYLVDPVRSYLAIG